MNKTLLNYLCTACLCALISISTWGQCPQEDIDFINVNVTDCTGTFSFDSQLCPSDQVFFELEQDILVPPNTQISWYADTDSNVDFTADNFIGVSEITTNPTTVSPCNPCPELLGIMVDACQDIQGSFNYGPEPNNEFAVIGSGGGFNTSQLTLDLAIGNNFEPGGTPPGSNGDITPTGPCFITAPTTAIIANVLQSVNCVEVFAAGPNTDIPAGAIFLLFTSNAASPYYNFDDLCANGAPIYIGQSSCNRTIGAFTNGSDSGFRTTLLEIDCGCNSSITHDTGNPILQSVPPTTGGGIVYYDINDNLVYELTNCLAPPVNLIPLPPVTSNVAPFGYSVTAEDCGNTITIQGILSPTFDGCDESLTPTFEFTVVCETPNLGEATICVGQTVDLEDLLDPLYTDGFWFDNSGQLTEFTATEVGPQEVNFFSTDCCVIQTSTTITVTEGTSVMAIPDTLICPGQTEIDLDGLILESSIPAGSWNGVGVNGSIFDPSGFQDEIVVVSFDPEECGPFTNVNITIAEAPELTFSETICRSDSVTINGEVYNFDRSTDIQFIEAMIGCDTALNIMIDFYDQPESMYIDSICADQNLMVGDSTFNSSKLNGTVIFTGQSSQGCDSLVNVELTIKATPPETMFSQPICPGDSIEIAGVFYHQNSLTGSETIQAANGCDSTINISLQLIADAVNNINFNLCDDRDTMINSVMYTSLNPTGRDTIESAAINGCDSILIVSINFISETMGTPVEQDICRNEGFSLTIGNQTFDADNPVGFGLLQASNGCDSIIPVELTVLENISGPDYVQNLCAGSNFSVTFSDETFDQSNTNGIATIPASNGCDSIFQVNLTFSGDIAGQDFETTECSGSGYEITFGTETFNELIPTGSATLQTAEGCDSTFQVNLNFSPTIVGPDFTNTDCVNSGYEVTFGTNIFNEANPSGIAIVQTTAGCDSTFNVVLTFQDAIQGPDFTNQDCVGSGYEVTFGADSFDEANPTGMATIPSAAGCDSTFNVVLTFQDAIQGPDFTNQDCVGSGYEITFGADTFDEANPTGTATILSAAGCDSTFNVVLTFQDAILGPEFTTQDCVGSGYEVTFGADTFDEANPTGMATIPSAAGCDSTFNVVLTFQDAIQGPDFTNQDCVGSGYEVTFGADTFDEANPTGMATIASAAGCDSTFNVVLTFLDAIQGPDFTNQDCVGSGYEVTFGADTFDEANPTGMATIASAAGCDSTFNVVLTFLDAIQGPDFTNQDCVGSGYEVTFGADTFDEANPTGMATIPSAAGCDSTFNVVLTFQDAIQGPEFTNQDCVGSGYEITFGPDTFDEANPTGMATIPSAAGCDSTFNVVLTFQDAIQGPEFTNQDCVGSGYEITFGPDTFDEANPTGMATIASAAGCDSTFNVVLTFQDAIQGPEFTNQDCVGSGYEITFGANTFDEANPTGMATIPTAAGCDSTFNVVLTFQDAIQGPEFTNQDCVGSGYEVTFGANTFDEANPTGMATIASAAGCDSTFNVVLTFQDAIQGPDFTNQDCVGSGYEVTFGADTFDEANPTGMATIPSAAGCDSTFNVVLTFQDAIQGPDFTNQDCVGSGYEVTFGADTFDEANPTGMATISSSAGCDSTFNVALTFEIPSLNEISGIYCIGDGTAFTVGTEVFDEDNPTGTVILQNANSLGCDSTVMVNLSFDENNIGLVGDEAICSGEAATIIITTSATGTFDLSLSNLDGEEESFTNLTNGSQITITPQSSSTFFISNVTGIDCVGDLSLSIIEIEVSEIEVELNAINATNGVIDCNEEGTGGIEAIVEGAIGEINFLWNQGDQSNMINDLDAGQYSVVVTDEIGCSDTESLELLNGSSIEIDFTLEQIGCEGNEGILTINSIAGGTTDSYSIILDEEPSPLSEPIFPVVFSVEAGDHTINVVDEFGCSKLEEFELIPTDPEDVLLSVSEDQSIAQGSSIPLSVMGNFPLDSIVWTPAISLSCTNCANPIAQPIETTIYTVSAFDDKGCSATAQVVIRVDKNSSIYIPNVFSPNGDGINDFFYVFGGSDVSIVKEFSIFDRWGNQVFFAENIPHNDVQFGWDGKFRGKKKQPDVFVYYGVVELIDGFLVKVEGNVTLIK